MKTTEIEDRVTDQPDDQVDEALAEAPDAEPAADTASRHGLVASIALLVVAALVMVSGLFTWWQSAHDDEVALAERRDAVLITARQHIETLQSLDYRSVEEGIDAWLDVTTGTLRDQLSAVGADELKTLADQKKISTGRVVEAAVLDLDGSSATVIASVEITVADDPSAGTEPTVKRNRFSADLVEVKGTWKLENIQQVAVALS